MRIAYLLHFYPPSSCGGAGLHTVGLAEGFHAKGAEVGVLCAGDWGTGEKYLNGVTNETRNGVYVRRLHINWKKAPRPFDWLYDSPVIGEQAAAFLSEFQPDIVHVSSCYTLSARPILVAKEMGFPVVLHIHDYWFICARLSLTHKDQKVCSGPDSAWKCQKCNLEGTKAWSFTSHILSDPAQHRLFDVLGSVPFFTRQPGLIGQVGDFQQRRHIALKATSVADTIIIPTLFTKNHLVHHSVSNKQIKVIPYGHEISWAKNTQFVPSQQFRIGFLGNIIPKKGVHLLLEAFEKLIEESLPVQLSIWGDTSLTPEYVKELKDSSNKQIYWGGRYSRDDLPKIFSNLDVVVVPSIWYEVQPLVVQEAFAAGVPVVVSDNSSLADGVRDGVDGLHFRMGSVVDLAEKLKRLCESPDLLDKLRSNVPPVRTVYEEIEEYSQLYNNLIREVESEKA